MGKAYPAFWACQVKNADGTFCKAKPNLGTSGMPQGIEATGGIHRFPSASNDVLEALKRIEEKLDKALLKGDGIPF